jgi:ribosome-associated translation inhibitor RaiA
MQVLVNTDHNIEGSADLSSHVEALVQDTLGRFTDRLTRVEVFLADENSAQKGGELDKRCTMEARPNGLQPIVVTHEAATLDQALYGAADKLEHTLKRHLGRLDQHKGRTSFAGDQDR